MANGVQNTYKCVDKCVYNAYNEIILKKGDVSLKQRDLLKKLESAGFVFKEHGANHDTYKRGKDIEQVPRHTEINEITAKKILKKWGLK